MINNRKFLELRINNNLNLSYLSVQLGISSSTIYKTETDPYYNPSTKVVLKYMKYFSVSSADLEIDVEEKRVRDTIKMHGKKYILSIKKELSELSGVYFLIQKDEIVYIGKSKNIYGRICYHKMQFDSFTIIECKGGDIGELERKYIMKFKPKYNKDFK